MEKDAQIMIKMLPGQIERENKMKQKSRKKASQSKSASIQMADCVAFDYTEEAGRFAKSNRDINVGEELLTEKPHCATLFETSSTSHCQNCLSRYICDVFHSLSTLNNKTIVF